jgi:hypothetical protein
MRTIELTRAPYLAAECWKFEPKRLFARCVVGID